MSDLRELESAARALSAEDAAAARILADALREWDATVDRAAGLAVLNERLTAAGLPALSCATAYRKLAAWRRGGLLAIADGRKLRKAAPGGVQGNREFCEYWQTLQGENARSDTAAWRKLIARLAGGSEIPGMGTWREVWAAEHGGARPGKDMPCPYSESDPPRGWTLQNLRRVGLDAFGKLAARRGMGVATLAAVPPVMRTRADLQLCQVVQVDDMWHEAKVAYAGNKHAQRVVELSMIDVLTGKVICWLCKPVRETENGQREVLRARWMRFLLAHLLCDVGIPARGCLIQGERGTATVDGGLAQVLADVSGGKVRFGSGGIISGALAKGLAVGQPHGNPRYKALLEGCHRIIKDRLGDVRGLVGGGRGREPEAVYGMDQQDEQLRRMAEALEERRPGILRRLALPYMPYEDFLALVDAAYQALNRRVNHQLEGWEAAGFVSGEYRAPGGLWVPVEALEQEPEELQAQLRALIGSGKLAYRQRRMSPEEAFKARQGELTKLPPFAGTLIMGEGLAMTVTCSKQLQLVCKDAANGIHCTVAGVLETGATLTRGAVYRVWVNPLSPGYALVADAAGRFLGRAPIQAAAAHDDDKQLAHQLGIRRQVLAAEHKRLAPVIRARVRRAADAAATNVIEILGMDPAAAEQEREAAQRILARADVMPLDAITAAKTPAPASVGAITAPEEPTLTIDQILSAT